MRYQHVVSDYPLSKIIEPYLINNNLYLKERIVENKILPISVVFPAQTLDKASWIFFSVFVSKAEVASSNKTKTGV